MFYERKNIITVTLLTGDVIEQLRTLPDGCVQTCVTSPPYYGLRDYGTAKWEGGDPDCDHKPGNQKRVGKTTLGGGTATTGHQHEGYKGVCPKCGAIRIDDQIGLEETPEAYVAKLVEVFREVRRVLKDDGTVWLNLGDSFWGGKGQSGQAWSTEHTDRDTLEGHQHQITGKGETRPTDRKHETIKPKDMIGIPWMVAFALRADGWWLRQDIIWCLSGGAYIYAKTQKGVLPTMVRDLARLDPTTVQLWNGEKWTRLLGISKSKRRGNEIEIVLRSGERISCTPTHRFPTDRGLIEAGQLQTGDVIQTCRLPDADDPRDCAIDEDAAWFAGLYLAEGSHSDDTIQIAGHSKETERWVRICKIANKYGGFCTRTIDGNNMNIRIHGKILNAIIDELVTGRIAKDKGFSPSVWKYSNKFISAMLNGYLSGDGHFDAKNNRWRLGFTRNYNLERDLRTACARLGYCLTLNLSTVEYKGRQVPTFRGEIRMQRTGHHNERNMGEIIAIQKSRCREVYDLGISDEPHLFSLASGVLTHNSKPNPMPESVTDRCTKSHEYIFLLTKSARYFYDANAIAEPANYDGRKDEQHKGATKSYDGVMPDGDPQTFAQSGNPRWNKDANGNRVRNKRDVWTVATKPYRGAHFATFPPALIEPCILAGTSERGECPKCGKAWIRDIVRKANYTKRQDRSQPDGVMPQVDSSGWKPATITNNGWRPQCDCGLDPVPQVVLDIFNGSGTTGEVSIINKRNYIGIDLNPKYIKLSQERFSDLQIKLI